jgi:hypothetical protein
VAALPDDILVAEAAEQDELPEAERCVVVAAPDDTAAAIAVAYPAVARAVQA